MIHGQRTKYGASDRLQHRVHQRQQARRIEHQVTAFYSTLQDVRDLLTNMRAADLQLVEPEPARQEYESYLRGQKHDLSALWPTLTLEAWLREHFA